MSVLGFIFAGFCLLAALALVAMAVSLGAATYAQGTE